MRQFTFKSFINILKTFRIEGYNIITVEDYFSLPKNSKVLLLRHDVDRYPFHTLKMAKLEKELGIRSTYYFRIIPTVFKEDIIKQVNELGREVAYHYEDLTLVNGNYEKAIKHFKEGLNKIRKFSPAKTICMHGSPLSKWDNKKLWEKYDYKDFGIIGDTSLDIDYNEVFYISDNGWGWNKTATSIRDKVDTKFNIPIKNTNHLIDLIKKNKLPDKIMLNAHPDTFNDNLFPWIINYLIINSKNIIKRFIVKYKIIK